ncbi:MAG: hypothetical protein ACRDFQ_01685 [Anaerolineales bacterium]
MKLAIYTGAAIWISAHLWLLFFSSTVDPALAVALPALGTFAMLIGTFGLSQRAEQPALRLSFAVLMAGMVLYILGVALTALGAPNAAGIAALGLLVITLALLAVGIANIRARLFGPFFWLPLAMGFVYLLSWAAPGGNTLMSIVYGFGWFALGAKAHA